MALVFTNVIHPDVLLANSMHYLSKRHLEKKLNRFNNALIDENDEIYEEAPAEDDVITVEGEVIDADPIATPA